MTHTMVYLLIKEIRKMKKTYIIPTMGIVKIATQHQMLAGSMGGDTRPVINFTDAKTDTDGYYAD